MRSLLEYARDAVMSATRPGAGCALQCSDRGDCLNGTCLCEIRYAGEQCSEPNVSYHACIGGVFLAVSLVCGVQLVACVLGEYRRMKVPSLCAACKVTTQKMLYLLVLLASLIRGAYFVSPATFEEGWASSLLSAYYPLLMSGASLVVCFWAEVFHLRDVRWESPRFLSKSLLGFATFNAISYSLLLTEVLLSTYLPTPPETKSQIQHVFNGCYAVLLFIVVIFFLIYGVEVFFKVRGGFLSDTRVHTIHEPAARTATAAWVTENDDREADVTDHLVTRLGVRTEVAAGRVVGGGAGVERCVDRSQLQQSRLGLLSQAVMLILVVCFLASETLSELWKTKVPVNSRNWHDIVFRLAEIGVSLWFPCVLWNCMAPERLWLLNPRRLLSRQLDDSTLDRLVNKADTGETISLVGSTSAARDCFICMEHSEPLMQPCRCTSFVHHSCLLQWLIETGATACKVCLTPYTVSAAKEVEWLRGFTATHWARTACVVVLVVLALCGALVGIQLSERTPVRLLCIGGAFIVSVVCFRVLAVNTATALQRAKMTALEIAPAQATGGAPLQTISSHVTVSEPDTHAIKQALRGEKE